MSVPNDGSGGTTSQSVDHSWDTFRVIGGIAALTAAIVFRRWLSAEFGMLRSFGLFHSALTVQPSTPLDWFTLLRTNRFVGLLLLNAFDLVNYALVGLMYFGVYSALRRSHKGYLAFAMGLSVVGTAVYFTSNQAFGLLSLSNQYYAATGEPQKSLILAAGQSALTVNDPVVFGTGTFWGFMFLYLAGMVISLVMLQGKVFDKWTASIGIVANAFGLGYFFTAAFAPTLSIIPPLGSALVQLGLVYPDRDQAAQGVHPAQHESSVFKSAATGIGFCWRRCYAAFIETVIIGPTIPLASPTNLKPLP